MHGISIINYICDFLVNHSFSVKKLFTYILSIETLKTKSNKWNKMPKFYHYNYQS